MMQNIKTFTFSDETKKMSILTRLVKEGHITLEEAFELSDFPDANHLGPVKAPQVFEPNPIWRNPHITYPTPNTPLNPWFGINDPLTGERIGPIFTTSTTIS